MTTRTRADEYRNEITAAQASFPSVPRVVIEAVAAIESNFSPRAYLEEQGGDGSVGLMQIRLSTARGEGYTGTKDHLFRPAVNLYYGTSFLNGLAKLIPGPALGRSRWERIVSGYNGGLRFALGFGRPVEKDTTVCLRRDPATGKCLKSFTAKPGEFGNEAHVQRFLHAVRGLGGGLPERPDLDTAPG